MSQRFLINLAWKFSTVPVDSLRLLFVIVLRDRHMCIILFEESLWNIKPTDLLCFSNFSHIRKKWVYPLKKLNAFKKTTQRCAFQKDN